MALQAGRDKFMAEQERLWRAQGWDNAQIVALMAATAVGYDEGWDQGTKDAGYSPSEVREAHGE
jgi:hypothetical protein